MVGLMRIALALAVIASAVVPFGPPVEAATGLGVAPSKLELGVREPGTEITRQFTLRATGDNRVAVEVQIFDYAIDENNTFRFSDPGTEPTSSAAWVSFSPTRITLEPGQIGKLDFKMQIPNDTEAGGHYSMAVFKFGAADAGGNQLSIQGSVAVQILVQVTGELRVTGSVQSGGTAATTTPTKVSQDPAAGMLKLDLPFLHEPGPIAIRSKFRVDGNAHLNVAARTWIADWKREYIATIDSGPYTVLPNSSRTVEALWEDPPAVGLFVAFQQIQDSAGGEQTLSFFFVIAPWKTMIVVLPFLIGIGWAVWVLTRGARGPRPS